MKYRKHGFNKGPRGVRPKEYTVSRLRLCDNEACQMPATTTLADGTLVCKACKKMVEAEGDPA